MSPEREFIPTGTSASGIVAKHAASIPVDLLGMAEDLGLTVAFSRSLPAGVSGRIYRSDKARAGYAIDVNATEPGTRQRFTLAHEIAHYVLHRDLIGDGVTDNALYRSALGSAFEGQANRYAAHILLPARAVRSEYRRGGTLSQMSERFKVSEAALTIRARQLGLAAECLAPTARMPVI